MGFLTHLLTGSLNIHPLFRTLLILCGNFNHHSPIFWLMRTLQYRQLRLKNSNDTFLSLRAHYIRAVPPNARPRRSKVHL